MAIDEDDPGCIKLQAAVKRKLEAAQEPAGLDVGPIEDALVRASLGKIVKLEGGYGRASIQAKSVGATPELAELMGRWIARQHWLGTGNPLTLIDVLNKWHTWLPKAKATEPPPGLEPGLGDTGSGTAEKRPASTRGRAKAGFR